MKTILKICVKCGVEKSSRYISKFNGTCKNCRLTKEEQALLLTKLKQCEHCKNFVKSSQCRHKYCKDCSKKGIGRKYQSKYLQEHYKGDKNPNYTDGKSKVSIYRSREWRETKKIVNPVCPITGLTKKLHYHHIIPARLLSNEEKYNTYNIIALHPCYHKLLHHHRLDIELLPILYPLYKLGAPQLQEEFVRLLVQFCNNHQIDVMMYQDKHLVQHVPSNYYKTIKNRFPEFFQQEFAHLL